MEWKRVQWKQKAGEGWNTWHTAPGSINERNGMERKMVVEENEVR